MTDLAREVYGRSSRSQIIYVAPGNLSRVIDTEVLHVALAMSALRQNPGDVMFTASPDHASVTGYTAQLWVSGHVGGEPEATLSLGVPTPDTFGNIVASLTSLYSGQAAGDYTVSILTTTGTGSADSEESNAFTLPLA